MKQLQNLNLIRKVFCNFCSELTKNNFLNFSKQEEINNLTKIKKKILNNRKKSMIVLWD